MTNDNNDRMPDIWWRNHDGTEMRYYYQPSGVWTWKLVKPDGTVITEGEGRP